MPPALASSVLYSWGPGSVTCAACPVPPPLSQGCVQLCVLGLRRWERVSAENLTPRGSTALSSSCRRPSCWTSSLILSARPMWVSGQHRPGLLGRVTAVPRVVSWPQGESPDGRRTVSPPPGAQPADGRGPCHAAGQPQVRPVAQPPLGAAGLRPEGGHPGPRGKNQAVRD